MDYNDFFKFDNTNAEAEESDWAKELKDRKDKCHAPRNTVPQNSMINLNLDDDTGDYIDRCYFANLKDKPI